MKASFKHLFFRKFDDPEIFNCDSFNIIKVAMDGVKTDYNGKGKVRTFFFQNDLIFFSVEWLKRWRFKRSHPDAEGLLNRLEHTLSSQRIKKLAILDESRYIQDRSTGIYKSYYFHNILELLGRDQVCMMALFESPRPELYDVMPVQYHELLNSQPLSREEHLLRKALKKTFHQIVKNATFNPDELANIQVGIELFFKRFRTWNAIFSRLKIEKVYMTEHYHREGIILALKRNGIAVCELQHGLISPEKSFYVWPEKMRKVVKRALFSDRIFVYGNYWKQNLLAGCEYDATQVQIIGRYFFEDRSNDPQLEQFKGKHILSGCKVILAASQFTITKDLIAYLKWLEKDIIEKSQQAVILLKPHPIEDVQLYDALLDSKIIKIVSFDLEKLFPLSHAFISCYSAAFYDASRYPLARYALMVDEFEEHIQAIVKTGVAQLLYSNENVLLKAQAVPSDTNTKEFSEAFNPAVLLEQN